MFLIFIDLKDKKKNNLKKSNLKIQYLNKLKKEKKNNIFFQKFKKKYKK